MGTDFAEQRLEFEPKRVAFRSRDKHSCKLIGTKKSVYINPWPNGIALCALVLTCENVHSLWSRLSFTQVDASFSPFWPPNPNQCKLGNWLLGPVS